MTTKQYPNKLDKNFKTPSFKDLMMGKKIEKTLPENFFEVELDLEVKVKRNFQMNYLQELISLYSKAIEYYQSIEDPKYLNYKNRLNSLLSRPDILRNMNEYSKTSKNF